MSPVSTRSRAPWLVFAASASALGLLASTGGVAGAGAPKVDATHYTVACSGLTSATVKFSQPQTTAGTATPSSATDTLKAKLSGCTVTPAGSGTAVSVSGATLSGALSNSSSYHKCGGSNGVPISITGNLTVKWKTTPKLTASSSVVTGSTATITIDTVHSAATFAVAGSSTTGPFQGTDSGAGDTLTGSTGANSVTGIATACASKSGLKGLTLSSPFSGSALVLG
jgi:hypothetical protein